MQIADMAYLAECKDCGEKYGFELPSERESYLSVWHDGHQVTLTSQEVLQ